MNSISLEEVVDNVTLSHKQKFESLGLDKFFIYQGEFFDIRELGLAINLYQRFLMLIENRKKRVLELQKKQFQKIIVTMTELLDVRKKHNTTISASYLNGVCTIKTPEGIFTDDTVSNAEKMRQYLMDNLYPGEKFMITEDPQLLRERVMNRLFIQRPGKFVQDSYKPPPPKVLEDYYLDCEKHNIPMAKVHMDIMPDEVKIVSEIRPKEMLHEDVVEILPLRSLNNMDDVNVRQVIYKDASRLRDLVEPNKYYGFEYADTVIEGKDLYLRRKWVVFLHRLKATVGDDIVIDHPEKQMMSTYVKMGFRYYSGVNEALHADYKRMYCEDMVFVSSAGSSYVVIDCMNNVHAKSTWDIGDSSPENLISEYGEDFYDRVISVVWGYFEKGSPKVKYRFGKLLHMGFCKAQFIAYPYHLDLKNLVHDWKVEEYVIQAIPAYANPKTDKRNDYYPLTVASFCLISNVFRNYVIFVGDLRYKSEGNRWISSASYGLIYSIIRMYRPEYRDLELQALVKFSMLKYACNQSAYDLCNVSIPMVYSRQAFAFNGAPRVIEEDPKGREVISDYEINLSRIHPRLQDGEVKCYEYNINNQMEVFNIKHLRDGVLNVRDSSVTIMRNKPLPGISKKTVKKSYRSNLAHNTNRTFVSNDGYKGFG